MGRQWGRAGTRSGPWTHRHPGDWKCMAKDFKRHFSSCHRSSGTDAHVCVRIVELHHDVGRRARRDLWVAENLHLVEDERLVPGGIEGVTYSHGFLRLVEEGDDGVGVWRETASSVNLRNTTVFKHYICGCASVWSSNSRPFTADAALLIGSSLSSLLWILECLQSKTDCESAIVSQHSVERELQTGIRDANNTGNTKQCVMSAWSIQTLPFCALCVLSWHHNCKILTVNMKQTFFCCCL